MVSTVTKQLNSVESLFKEATHPWNDAYASKLIQLRHFMLPCQCYFPLDFSIVQGRPLSAQYFSSLVGMRLSILLSVILSSLSLVYTSSTLSPVHVLHVSSSHAVPIQSSLRESVPRCPSDVFVSHLVFATLPVIIIIHHLHLAAVVSSCWANASACRLQISLSCAVLCHIVSLQYFSRSSLHRLAGLPCHLFLSYKWFPIGSQVVTREVHRSALMLLSYL